MNPNQKGRDSFNLNVLKPGLFEPIFAKPTPKPYRLSSVRKFKPDAIIEGVTIQPYFSNPDFEILLDVKRDANFGPVILFGMGGIYTKVFFETKRESGSGDNVLMIHL